MTLWMLSGWFWCLIVFRRQEIRPASTRTVLNSSISPLAFRAATWLPKCPSWTSSLDSTPPDKSSRTAPAPTCSAECLYMSMDTQVTLLCMMFSSLSSFVGEYLGIFCRYRDILHLCRHCDLNFTYFHDSQKVLKMKMKLLLN